MNMLNSKSHVELSVKRKGQIRVWDTNPVVTVFSPECAEAEQTSNITVVPRHGSMKSNGNSKPPLSDVDTPSIRNLIIRYASKSTIHGLPSTVAHSFYYGQRYLWFILVLCMAVALAVAITLQLKTYYEWPTVVNIKEVAMTMEDIPEVTVCDQEVLAFTFIQNPWNKSARSTSSMDVNVHTETLVLSGDPGCKRKKVQTGQCLLDKANKTERTRLLTSSVDRAGWFIPKNKYYPKVVTSMGVCHTFKTSVFLDDLSDVTKNMVSAQVPLDIVLAIKPSIKSFMRGHRSGIQITLHTKEEPPFPQKKKVFLPLGTSCRIKYQKILRRSLTTPYKSFIGEQCVDTTSPSFRNPLSRYSVYTKDTCLEECFVNFTISKCGCRYHFHPGSEGMCTSEEVLNCMEETRAAFSSHKKTCKCSPPCTEMEFESYVSVSKIARLEFPVVHMELMSSAEVKTEITQVPVYTVESIMGSLGGLIALFMGFSLVSLMEFVELIFIAISRCCSWKRRKQNK